MLLPLLNYWVFCCLCLLLVVGSVVVAVAVAVAVVVVVVVVVVVAVALLLLARILHEFNLFAWFCVRFDLRCLCYSLHRFCLDLFSLRGLV